MTNANTANKTLNIKTNGTTVIAGKFLLVAIVVGVKGASSNTAAIFDSTVTLGTDSDYAKGILDTVNTLGRVEYGIPMFNGIYIVTATGTAPDLLVIYRDL